MVSLRESGPGLTTRREYHARLGQHSNAHSLQDISWCYAGKSGVEQAWRCPHGRTELEHLQQDSDVVTRLFFKIKRLW